MFLAQLLRKHGLGARIVPYDAVSRAGIARLDVEGVAMVCISYLDISGRPSHLRYVLRRLKQRLPHARFLVGLWPTGEAALLDQDTQRFLGADFYVETLHDAVETCLRAAQEASAAQGSQGSEAGTPAETQAGIQAAPPARSEEQQRPALEKIPG